MSAPTDPLTPLADACPPLVDVPTGAGDADVECSNCCMPMDKPHTWRECAEGLWKQVSAKYDDECDARMKIMELEAELAPLRELASEAAITLPDLEDEEFRAECMARLGKESKALIEDAATLIQRLAAHHKEPTP